jgi:sugar phosphate isomerase/epimerase
MLSVSTTWNYARHGALRPAIAELADLGFEAVELRAKGAVPDLEEAGALCRDARIRCPSVHAPLTEAEWAHGDPSKGLGSLDEGRRKQAVREVLSTLRAAAPARASVAVLHLGQVDVARAKERQKEWIGKVVAGERPEGVEEAMAERAAARDAHLEAAARSLFDLTRAEPGITWAMEGRLYFHEIPALDEVELLLSDAGVPNVAYWHDTGHAHQLARIGVADALAWLDRYGSRAAGIHLHDVVGALDHMPPGGGELDWPGVVGYVSSGMIRVMEVHGRHSAGELLAGADYLRDLGLA